MLMPCPECERQVSDRAKACPDCGFPVAEHVAEQREAEAEKARLASRERVGEIDCPRCDARGFRYFEAVDDDGNSREVFTWCEDCRHSGRVHQCRDTTGYFAVSLAALEAFVAGSLDADDPQVHFVGTTLVTEHRYPQAGEHHEDDDDDEADADAPETVDAGDSTG